MIELYLLLGVGALLLAFVLMWLNQKISQSEKFTGNADNERRHNVLKKEVDPELASALDAEVRALLESGQKIEAIKYVRAQTGCDLKSASDYVERF